VLTVEPARPLPCEVFVLPPGRQWDGGCCHAHSRSPQMLSSRGGGSRLPQAPPPPNGSADGALLQAKNSMLKQEVAATQACTRREQQDLLDVQERFVQQVGPGTLGPGRPGWPRAVPWGLGGPAGRGRYPGAWEDRLAAGGTLGPGMPSCRAQQPSTRQRRQTGRPPCRAAPHALPAAAVLQAWALNHSLMAAGGCGVPMSPCLDAARWVRLFCLGGMRVACSGLVGPAARRPAARCWAARGCCWSAAGGG